MGVLQPCPIEIREFDAAATFDDFAGNLMAEDQPRRRRSASTHHVLVASADISRDWLDDEGMVDFPSLRRLHSTAHCLLGGIGVAVLTIVTFSTPGQPRHCLPSLLDCCRSVVRYR